MSSSYSLQDVVADLSGFGGLLSLGYGSALADEAVKIAMAEAKNTMTPGGDGEIMHSMHSANHGVITFRFLQTSPANALLQAMYNAQKQSATLWGQNKILIRHTGSGDTHTATKVAFQKKADVAYNKVGSFFEWPFDCGRIESDLGVF